MQGLFYKEVLSVKGLVGGRVLVDVKAGAGLEQPQLPINKEKLYRKFALLCSKCQLPPSSHPFYNNYDQ